MTRWYLLMISLAFPALILAQTSSGPNYSAQPYQPAVPAPSTTVYGGGGYGGHSGGTTAAGSALNGLGSAMSSAGSMHLSNSAAAINWTQAQKNEQQNKLSGEQTYFQMQNENQAYVKAHRGPQATKEQLARWARDEAPKAVTKSEVDPDTGKIKWPDVLQQDDYAPQRADLDELMVKKTKYGRLSYSDQLAARKKLESMFATMKSHVKDIPAEDYMPAHNFLNSMIYAMSKSELM